MQANKDTIGLETAKLLKDCGIKSKYHYVKLKHHENFHLSLWLNQAEFDNDEKEYLGIGISSYCEIEIETAIEYYPAYTWQEILWEHPEEFFGEDVTEYKGFSINKNKMKFITHHILRLLQQKKYEEADTYFREHCILIN